jgi:hypothetical protein
MMVWARRIFPMVLVIVLVVSGKAYGGAPVKLILSSHIGWEVDGVTKGTICTISSKDVCQPAKPSGEPGGFEYPRGVAVAPSGNVYVAEPANARVQELTAAGEFVLMFGREVNETKDKDPTSTEAERDLCTAAEVQSSAVKCKRGVAGEANGAFGDPQAVAVDPITENVYVQDVANWRVAEFTSGGAFVLMVGKEVDATKDGLPGATEVEKNLCTAISKDACKGGVESAPDSAEKGAFDFAQFQGDLLSIGGSSEHLLYVGDHHRIQELTDEGIWKSEIRLPSTVISHEPSGEITSIALDQTANTLYVVYNSEPVVYEFNAVTGEESAETIHVAARRSDAQAFIRGIASDAAGHIAIVVLEDFGSGLEQFASLYDASDGLVITGFAIPPSGSNGISFNEKGELYAAIPSEHEVLRYHPAPVAELITGAASCTTGVEHGTSDTADCILHGEINPYEVPNTEAWFSWDKTCDLRENTAKVPIEDGKGIVSIVASIEGLRPNQMLCYRLTGNDDNAQPPEELTGATILFKTPAVAPKILGKPVAQFVTSSSAVLHGELNPENAPSEFYFEYVAEPNPQDKLLADCNRDGEHCGGVATTAAGISNVYGKTGVTLEAKRLQPNVRYSYRLSAVNSEERNLRALGDEGEFTTAPVPAVEAVTGAASAVTDTSAHIEGTINPDGQKATYAFELSLLQGENTHYGIVFLGSTGIGIGMETESIDLTGLQPGAVYAYRISIHGGYGAAIGSPTRFTTMPAQSLLPPLITPTQLPVPSIKIPQGAPRRCMRGFVLNRAHKCVKVRKRHRGGRVERRKRRKNGEPRR